MLAIAVSLTFALSATLAVASIILTMHQQAGAIRAILGQARAARGEQEIPFSSRREAQALVAAFEPVVRPRRGVPGTVGPLLNARRASTFSSPFAPQRCVAA